MGKGFAVVERKIVAWAISLLAVIVLPNFVSARGRAQQCTCISNLKQIDKAKTLYALSEGKLAGDFVTMANLVTSYMKSEPSCSAGGAYIVGSIGSDPTCSVREHIY